MEPPIVEEVSDQPKSWMPKVAQLMTWKREQLLRNVQVVSQSLNMHRKTLERYVFAVLAVAEASLQEQKRRLESFLDYAQVLAKTNQAKTLFFCSHWRYDETPLKIRAMSEDANTTSGLQIQKTFVVETQYKALLQKPSARDSDLSQSLIVVGLFSPRVLTAQNASAKTIMKVIETASSIPDRAYTLFDYAWKVVETDEGGANMRAEAGFQQSQPIPTLHQVCVAHKVHTVGSRTWALPPFTEVELGIAKSMKLLKQPGAFATFVEGAVGVAVEHLQFADDISDDAKAWQTSTLALFAPSPFQSSRGGALVRTLASKLFNGDWRQGSVQHVCRGCCQDRADLERKVRRWLPKLCAALRARLLNKGDWLNWHSCLFFCGFLSRFHNLFQATLERTFVRVEVEPVPQGLRAGTEGHEEFSVLLRATTTFWSRQVSAHDLFIFRTATYPQQKLMFAIINNSENFFDAKTVLGEGHGESLTTLDILQVKF